MEAICAFGCCHPQLLPAFLGHGLETPAIWDSSGRHKTITVTDQKDQHHERDHLNLPLGPARPQRPDLPRPSARQDE